MDKHIKRLAEKEYLKLVEKLKAKTGDRMEAFMILQEVQRDFLTEQVRALLSGELDVSGAEQKRAKPRRTRQESR